MANYPLPKKNTAYTFFVGLIDQSNTKLLKANPTLATGDFKVSIDGGAFANLATLPTVSPAAGAAVSIALSSGEMNGDNIVVTCIDAAGAEWCDQIINIQTATRGIDDLAYPATSGRSMVVDANGLVDANAVKVGPTGAGTAQTARDIGASVLLSAGSGTGQLDFTSGVVKANLAQILGTALTETAGQIAAAFKKFFDKAAPTGTVNSLPDAVAGAANGLAIVGSNVGAATSVSGAVGSVTGAVGSVTGNVGGNVGGNVTGSVGSVAAGGITASSLASNAITAAKVATDAIGAAQLATDAVNEIAAGLLATALTQRNVSALATSTVEDALSAARAQGAGSWAIVGTTLTLKNPDGTTFRVYTLDSGTNPTSRT